MMDLKITDKVLAGFRDKDSKKARFRDLYLESDFLRAYAKHTDLRVQDDPQWAIGRGDEWESHGLEQLAFLQSEGLKPTHKLLDVGCGVGRAARRFVPYLDPGNYMGVDISTGALDYARELSVKEGWAARQPSFLMNAHLDLLMEFDFIWAHSVFTHLPAQQIERMIGNAAPMLPVGGKFLFTYKRADTPTRSGLKQFQYPLSFFASIAMANGMRCEELSKLFPAHQRTVRLTRTA